MADFHEGPPRAFIPCYHRQPGRGAFGAGYVERPANDVGECPLEVRTEPEAAERPRGIVDQLRTTVDGAPLSHDVAAYTTRLVSGGFCCVVLTSIAKSANEEGGVMVQYCDEDGVLVFDGTPYELVVALKDARAEVKRHAGVRAAAIHVLRRGGDDYHEASYCAVEALEILEAAEKV